MHLGLKFLYDLVSSLNPHQDRKLFLPICRALSAHYGWGAENGKESEMKQWNMIQRWINNPFSMTFILLGSYLPPHYKGHPHSLRKYELDRHSNSSSANSWKLFGFSSKSDDVKFLPNAELLWHFPFQQLHFKNPRLKCFQ